MTLKGTPNIIPLFPLPATVLFPKTYLPLHIFEPRYRKLVEDALADPEEGNRLIGMVLLKERWEKNYYGNPPIYGTGCAGRIMQVQRLNDGRYNLVLYGLEKFAVKDELFDRRYRRAWIEPIPVSGKVDSTLPEPLRLQLIDFLQIYARFRGWKNQIRMVLAMKLDAESLVQLLSSELDLTPIEKQFLLESDGLTQQCRRLIDLLGFMTEERRSKKKANRPLDTGS